MTVRAMIVTVAAGAFAQRATNDELIRIAREPAAEASRTASVSVVA